MVTIKNRSPVNYSLLCTDTVTVYHRSGSMYTTTVYSQAFFDTKRVENVGKLGQTDDNAFLVVIPGPVQTVYPGDKILRGRGPNVSNREQWEAMIPATTPGLVVAAYADPKCYGGRIVHTEAGR